MKMNAIDEIAMKVSGAWIGGNGASEAIDSGVQSALIFVTIGEIVPGKGVVRSEGERLQKSGARFIEKAFGLQGVPEVVVRVDAERIDAKSGATGRGGSFEIASRGAPGKIVVSEGVAGLISRTLQRPKWLRRGGRGSGARSPDY